MSEIQSLEEMRQKMLANATALQHPVLLQLNSRIAELEAENTLLRKAEQAHVESNKAIREEASLYKNKIRSTLLEVAKDFDGDVSTIEMIANSLDIELKETKSYSVNVTFEIDIEVPFGQEIDSDSFDWDIDFEVSSSSLEITDYRSDVIYANED